MRRTLPFLATLLAAAPASAGMYDDIIDDYRQQRAYEAQMDANLGEPMSFDPPDYDSSYEIDLQERFDSLENYGLESHESNFLGVYENEY